MEEYLSKTRTIVNQFHHNKLNFPEWISALDAALTSSIPKLQREDIPALRAVMFANDRVVREEMARRDAMEI